MGQIKKRRVSDYSTPPLRVGEGPFRSGEIAAMLRGIGHKPGSSVEIRMLVKRLNAVTIWYWFDRDSAVAPTPKMVLDTVGSIERYSGKLLDVMHPSAPADWTNLDDFSPDVSPALLGLLRDELKKRMHGRLASARHSGSKCDLTIGIEDIFGTTDQAKLLRFFVEVLAVVYDTSKHLRQTASNATREPGDRPEIDFLGDLRKIYREVLGRTPRRRIDRIAGMPSGPWFAFVKFCCRTAGIEAPDHTIDGWLRGRLSTAAGQAA